MITRVVENSLPGIAVALILMYSQGKVNDVEIKNLKEQIFQLTTDIKARDALHTEFQLTLVSKLMVIDDKIKSASNK